MPRYANIRTPNVLPTHLHFGLLCPTCVHPLRAYSQGDGDVLDFRHVPMGDETVGVAQRGRSSAGAFWVLQLGGREATRERIGVEQDMSDDDGGEERLDVLDLEGRGLPDEALLHMWDPEGVSVRRLVTMPGAGRWQKADCGPKTTAWKTCVLRIYYS